jgi:hypothetical protein
MSKNLEILIELVREFDGVACLDPSGNRPNWQVEFAFSVRPSPGDKADLHPVQDPWDTGLRRIRIYRDDESLCGFEDAIATAVKSPNPTKELASVSHELGHHYLWVGQKIPKPRSRPREIEYAEEVLAWAIGRNILAVRGFEEWKLFDEEQERSLKTYRDEFGLHEAAEKIAAEVCSREAELIDQSRSWPGPRAGHP